MSGTLAYVLGLLTLPVIGAVWLTAEILLDGLLPSRNYFAFGCSACGRWWGLGHTDDGKWTARMKVRWHKCAAHIRGTR